MSVPAGWSPDPYGRYAQRYWDGAKWTAHVVDGEGTQLVDPLGTSMVVPFATPASATGPGPGAGAAPGSTPQSSAPKQMTTQSLFGTGGAQGFVDSFGESTKTRRDPSAHGAFGAAGGALASGGLALAILGEDPSRGIGVVVGLVLTALGVVVKAKTAPNPRDLHGAAAAAFSVGAVILAVAITNGGSAWAAIVIALIMIAAWILPPFRSHPFMLGAGVYAFVAGIGTAIGNAATSDDPFNEGEGLFNVFGIGSTARSAGLFYLFAALVLAFVVHRVDQAGHRAISAALLVTAMLSSISGVAMFGLAIGNAGGFLVTALVGAVLAYVGSIGEHRATLWFGAVMAAVGTGAFGVGLFKPDSPTAGGVIALGCGLLALFGPRLFTMVRKSQAK